MSLLNTPLNLSQCFHKGGGRGKEICTFFGHSWDNVDCCMSECSIDSIMIYTNPCFTVTHTKEKQIDRSWHERTLRSRLQQSVNTTIPSNTTHSDQLFSKPLNKVSKVQMIAYCVPPQLESCEMKLWRQDAINFATTADFIFHLKTLKTTPSSMSERLMFAMIKWLLHLGNF